MYAGHFAITTVLQQYYPSFSPYVFSFGVVLPDIANGIAVYFGIEGFDENPNGGLMAVDVHCNYTHSLFSIALLSALYGLLSGFPGFLASASHFFLDWSVHNADLVLDPISQHVIGGTGLWGEYPEFSYFMEAMLCVACTAYAAKDRRTLMVNVLIMLLHVQFRFAVPQLLDQVLKMDLIQQQHTTGLLLTMAAAGPAWLFGYILTDNSERSKRKPTVFKK